MLQNVEEKSGKSKKKSQPDMQLQLAVESIVEHSMQVAAMLPGGERKLLQNVMHCSA